MKKNKSLLRMLCPAFNKSLLFHGQQLNEIIFPLNAKTPGPQDHAVAGEITKEILNAATDTEARETPISWFKFEQHLQKLASQGTRILSREQYFQIAHLLILSRVQYFQIAHLFYLSEKDFDAALDHLSSLCVIHYYYHLLPKVVFIDPHFLVGMISEIVKYHYVQH